jgi:hypothetical protein
MCPACLAAAATTWLVAGSATTAASGLGALVWSRRRVRAEPDEDFQLRMQPEPDEFRKLERGERT